MNEVEFKNWLIKNGMKSKVASDMVSRVKRLEKEIKNCDIDEQYHSDKCKYLFSLLDKNGNNSEMEKYPDVKLPIGKYYMSTYRYSLKQYVLFCEGNSSEF